MSSTRQDAWTHDEDLLLAEVVLRHIRDGGTQLQAFEEVGKQMNRTAAACGFRWNSYVRKQYKSGIELAKKQRKERKGKSKQEESINATIVATEQYPNDINENTNESLEKVIKFLQQLQNEQGTPDQNAQENKLLKQQVHQLQQSLKEINQNYEKQKKEYQELQEEYSTMISILDRARKLTVQHNN
ncbi:hypothetical protein J6TS2_02000 [Heyndrickxia sporothermodurans]|nr:hypothetical protein J6TS2_02000 [Heyndrickxia sporothermodurans]